jgi:dephospho-CoA kinase
MGNNPLRISTKKYSKRLGNKVEKNKLLIAFVGMPGSGKTEATAYLHQKGIPCIRFGDITDEGLKAQNLPVTPENEREFREVIRRELGMAAYAIKSEEKIEEMLQEHDTLALDGLYSWGEYIYLKENFPQLTLVHVYAKPPIRYSRLAKRPIRPVPLEKSRNRDISEIEKLDKGGPIAIADHMIENNDDDLAILYGKIDILLQEIGVKV